MKLFSVPNNYFSSQKGFTLIELLVVIGILGILAASLVATIDPFEQLKKANDAKVQNAAVEFQTANIRYFAAVGLFPWETGSTGGAQCLTAATGDDITTPVKLDANTMDDPTTGCLKALIDAGELKSGFLDVTGVLDKVFVTEQAPNTGGSSVVQVCYLPSSLSGQRDKAAKYMADSNVTPTTFTATTTTNNNASSCRAYGGTTDCFWCTQ